MSDEERRSRMAEVNTRRDRLAPRLAELARKLSNPTPANVELLRKELERLARG